MKFTLDYPATLRSLSVSEIREFNIWLERLTYTLKRFFNGVEDDNISSVSADKISGKLPLSKLDIPGGSLTVSDDGFMLSSTDGSYIELTGGTINIHANII